MIAPRHDPTGKADRDRLRLKRGAWRLAIPLLQFTHQRGNVPPRAIGVDPDPPELFEFSPPFSDEWVVLLHAASDSSAIRVKTLKEDFQLCQGETRRAA
jgi:hypothetical protein